VRFKATGLQPVANTSSTGKSPNRKGSSQDLSANPRCSHSRIISRYDRNAITITTERPANSASSLPFPLEKITVAKVAITEHSHKTLKRTHGPGLGINPCGLPPLAFQENQNAAAAMVEIDANNRASQVQRERQSAERRLSLSAETALHHPIASNVAGSENGMMTVVSPMVAPNPT